MSLRLETIFDVDVLKKEWRRSEAESQIVLWKIGASMITPGIFGSRKRTSTRG